MATVIRSQGGQVKYYFDRHTSIFIICLILNFKENIVVSANYTKMFNEAKVRTVLYMVHLSLSLSATGVTNCKICFWSIVY